MGSHVRVIRIFDALKVPTSVPGGDFIGLKETEYGIGQSAASERDTLGLLSMCIPINEKPAGGQTAALGASKRVSMCGGNVSYWTR